MTEGRPWRAEGIRHAQVDGSLKVPKVVQAAMMLPRYQRVLYNEVALPRCEGYASSVIRSGEAAAANVKPNPIIKRAPINIPVD